MKRYYVFSFILVLGLILGACGSPDNQDNTDAPDQTNQQNSESPSGNEESSVEPSEENGTDDEGEDTELAPGVDTVISSVEQLDSSLEDPEDVNPINEKGKTLEEDWDRIEKKVEESFPDQYKKIEESLYPLINEAKKDQPDIEKMKEWVQPTLESLNELKQNIMTQ
ncbi:hypothetical protein MUO14_13165 [Halobacillus shinanisalinarum]|uniref:Lipoprotein n=1 Tax=Halobacillus shinanisalinarum TaxID=2932258 RepID=A0ABY4GUA6_9BACI|nr:hypothetical protein [Halobacillus shinanisalinarum]UOQ91531.1 hypothetical protein MUO14_13165 [Halobacillus shinanisalinarum]